MAFNSTVQRKNSKRKKLEEGIIDQPKDDTDGHLIIQNGTDLTERCTSDFIILDKILKVLGKGTFATVVECWDRRKTTRVAIKVIKSIQKYRDAAKSEIHVLNCLKMHDPENFFHCIHLIETFDFANHVCLVFELLSVSLYDLLKENHYRPFSLCQIQQFAGQIFKSLSFLHGLTLIHTDIKPENILLVNSNTESPTSEHRSKRRRQESEVNEEPKAALIDTDIRLIDFGSAIFDSEYHPSIVSTRHYRAPEVILGLGWSYPCDIWSVGCLLVEFLTGEALFQTHENAEHLAMMEVILGDFSQELLGLAAPNTSDDLLIRQLNRFCINFPTPSTKKEAKRFVYSLKKLDEIILSDQFSLNRPTKRKETQELLILLDLIRKCLDFNPETRITALDALQHKFFFTNYKNQ